MPVPAGAISQDNTPRAFLSLPTHASSSRSIFRRQHWKHFYLYLPMPVPAGAISQDNTPRAFLSLPTHASSSGSYFPRQHSKSISIFTYPCQLQRELFHETTLWEHLYLYLPMRVPAGAISWDNTPRAYLSLLPMPVPAGAISRDNTLRAFLFLPTHASSSISYFPGQHSEGISIFTYSCQFQQELLPETTVWEHFHLYIPMPIPGGAISQDNTLTAFLSLPTHASSSRSYFSR